MKNESAEIGKSKVKLSYLNFMRERKHLPPMFQDFHLQKLIFKFLYHAWVLDFCKDGVEIPNKDGKERYGKSWRNLHIMTIDGLLYTLGVTGYVLGRKNTGFIFKDLYEEVSLLEQKEHEIFNMALFSKKDESEEEKAENKRKFNSLSESLNTPIEVDEKLRKWVDEGNHLPEILKSQEYKNALSDAVLFIMTKNSHEYIQTSSEDRYFFIFDLFLKYAAHYGFVLKKSRANIDFIDLEASLAYFKEKGTYA